MDKALFERLTHSMAQMNEIIEGTRQPSRTFEVDAMKIKEINWEQGRRSPTGPAKALLRAIANDPQHVLQALNR